MEFAAQRFIDTAVKPSLSAPRGEPRVRAFFDNWLAWPKKSGLPGGCFFVAVACELDDKPGLVRDRCVQLQRDWLDALAQGVRIAVSEGHFRKDVDPDQFAYEMYGIMLVNHHFSRLLRDAKAEPRARKAFDALVSKSRKPAP